jgi:hypothetical protein
MRSRCGTPRRAFWCDCADCTVAPHLVWADGGHTGGLVDWCRQKLALTPEIVKRTDGMQGFVVRPRRWVAERTFTRPPYLMCDELWPGFETLILSRTGEWEEPWTLVGGHGSD